MFSLYKITSLRNTQTKKYYSMDAKWLYSLFNVIIRFFFTIDIKLISFFSDNLAGYIFYIFCIFYGFFGCVGDNCNITHSLAAIFVVFMIGLVIQTYGLVKIPFTREYLENLVKKDFIEKHLGNYTGSEALVKIFKYVGPAISLVAAETITANQQSNRFLRAAKLTEENFFNDFKKMNRIATDEEYQVMVKLRNEYLDKAANANGIIVRGLGRGFAASDTCK